MAKKFITKALSVGLSLAMCAGMVAPAFAASFRDLNNAIGGTYEGSAFNVSESDGIRNITLNESVTYGGGSDDKTISISGSDTKVNIDLNGWEIDGGARFEVAEDKTSATITKQGSGQTVVKVGGGAQATISNGTIKGGYMSVHSWKTPAGITVTGEGTSAVLNNVNVTENYSIHHGGGIFVVDGASLIMNGGSVTNNYAKQNGGGIATLKPSGGRNVKNIKLDGVEISDNVAGSNGGGLWFCSVDDALIKDCAIKENYVGEIASAMLIDDTTAQITGGTITGNVGPNAVIKFQNEASVSMSGTIIRNNEGNNVLVLGTYAGENGEVSVIGCVIQGNHCTDSSAVYDSDYRKGDVSIEGNTICDNGNEVSALATGVKTMHDGEVTVRTVRENVTTTSYDLVVYCRECGEELSRVTVTINPNRPINPGIDDDFTDTADDAATAIDDEDVPLAGIYTRADAIGYLWEQTGSPEAELSDFPDVPEEHYWAEAIGWAQDMGIALADEDGNFRPDDMVLRSTSDIEGELQEFLNRYAAFAGVELADGELFIELEGEPSDVIMGEEAQVIFDGFFEKLEAALAEKAA